MGVRVRAVRAVGMRVTSVRVRSRIPVVMPGLVTAVRVVPVLREVLAQQVLAIVVAVRRPDDSLWSTGVRVLCHSLDPSDGTAV